MKRRLAAFLSAMCMAVTMCPVGSAVQVDDGTLPPVLTYRGMLCLVNRSSKVTKKYIPEDLRVPQVLIRKGTSEESVRLREPAARALERMFQSALDAGHTLIAASGYRSFGVQELRFKAKVAEVGTKEKAWRTVAPPGASEHQLGLAMDLQSASMPRLNRDFGETPEGIWVAQNAHCFGFVVRYQRAWTQTTGYLYEPWHVRYLGIAHAGALFSLDIPYEEYYEVLKNIPEYVLLGATDVLLTALVSSLRSGDTSLLEPLLVIPLADQEAALQAATEPLLPEGIAYEAAVARCFPDWAQEAATPDVPATGAE